MTPEKRGRPSTAASVSLGNRKKTTTAGGVGVGDGGGGKAERGLNELFSVPPFLPGASSRQPSGNPEIDQVQVDRPTTLTLSCRVRFFASQFLFPFLVAAPDSLYCFDLSVARFSFSLSQDRIESVRVRCLGAASVCGRE